MDNRRDFIKKAAALAGGTGLMQVLPASIQKAMAINPAAGSTFLDAEHIVLLMQENRSFDHTYGSLQGVRGFHDPRAIRLPNKYPVWLQSNKEGDTYAPFRLNIKDTKATWMSSLPHSWSNQVDARNGGRYDKWLDVKHSGNEDYAAMPLTMGYYTRQDIPFYYALADAFTVCDQHFCSSLTGTTPNRLYFWTGTIREKQAATAMARVWNEDADYETMVSWTSFPERLEENNISWKVYQNELSVGVGFTEEEEAWLANFGDNALEYFTQYHVKLSAGYIENLPKAAIVLDKELKEREGKIQSLDVASKEAVKIKREIEWLKKQIAINTADQKFFTKEKYEQLPQREKNLHNKAFSSNSKDPHYHQLVTLSYHDGNMERELKIPKGDVLHQFREDVKTGALPTVSWIVAPENFSDHPSSAWYGAWYISEVMDILTQNPEVWKKTIFILTYDENDGYFDHVPPFVAPHPEKKGTGMVSAGIDTSIEHVIGKEQQSIADQARDSSIGLGYRVPLVIASPWSRGGWVNSEVFDHTSSLQFLEKFLTAKTKKKIEETNISKWRRTVCGDLSSVFRPWNGEKIDKPVFVERDVFIEGIHKAKFKNPPSNFKKLRAEEISLIQNNPHDAPGMPQQETGIRSSCALPYELYADGNMSTDKKVFSVQLGAGNKLFGNASAGSPFIVYSYNKYGEEDIHTRNYAVAAGDSLQDEWTIDDFENKRYHLCVYGPNGFFREFTGNDKAPAIACSVAYSQNSIELKIVNNSAESHDISIIDNAYKAAIQYRTLTAHDRKSAIIRFDLSKNYGWYDFTVRIKGDEIFAKRCAGRVETGLASKTDPFMGRVV